MDANTLYEQVRKQVQKRYQQRIKYVTSIVSTLAFNALIWFAWTHTDPGVRLPECLMWGVSAVSVIDIIGNSIKLLMGELEGWTLQREFERNLQLMVGYDPSTRRKHDDYEYDDPAVELTDDGELVEGYGETWDSGQKQKRQ